MLTCVSPCLVATLSPILCDPLYCNPRGSSAHGIFQARILEWVVISYSRGSSQPSDQTHICLAGRFLTTVPPGKSLFQKHLHTKKKIYRCSKIMNLHPPICLKKKKKVVFLDLRSKGMNRMCKDSGTMLTEITCKSKEASHFSFLLSTCRPTSRRETYR